MEDTLVERPGQREPRLEEHVHHREVVAEHVRIERVHAAVARHFRQPFQHAGAEPMPLHGVGDGERDLRPVGLDGIDGVRRYTAQAVAPFGNDHHPRIVDRRHPPRFGKVDAGNRHEAVVEASLRQVAEQREHPLGVVLADGAQPEGRSITQDDVGLEVRGIGGAGHALGREHR